MAQRPKHKYDVIILDKEFAKYVKVWEAKAVAAQDR